MSGNNRLCSNNNPAANAWAAVVAAATSDVTAIAAGIAQMTTEGVRSDVRRGFGRVAWRLLSTVSFVAGIVAFLMSRLAACMTAHAVPVRAPDPSPVSIRQSPLATIDAKGIFVSSALSPDGALLATATKSPASARRRTIALQIWDTRSAGLPQTIAKIPACPVELHFSVDAKFLLAVTPRSVLCYNVKTKMMEKAISPPHDSSGKTAFSPDGKMLAVPNKAGKVYLLSLATGKVLRTFTPQRDYIRDCRTDILNLAFSPDNHSLAISASANPPFYPDSFPTPSGILTLWNISTGDRRRTVQTGEFVVDSIAFSSDQSTVTAVGQMFGMKRGDGYYGACKILDLTTGIGHDDVFNREDCDPLTNYVAPHGRFSVGATGANLYVWNPATGGLIAKAPLGKVLANATTQYNESDQPSLAVDFSEDGSTIAVDDTHRILLFHVEGL